MSLTVVGRGAPRPDCDSPLVFEFPSGRREERRCRATSSVRCEPCAVTYRRRVRRIADSGRVRFPGSTCVMVTLTAPGDREHYLPNGDVCPCTPSDGVHLGEWNGSCSLRLSRFIEDLRRLTGEKVQYFRAAEVQKRGALHFHLLFRTSNSRGFSVSLAQVRRLAIKHGFGHSVDVAGVGDERAAGYVAKYVSKACAQRTRMPWVHRRTGEVTNGYGRYRVWTSSRSWGLTMAAVRAAQADWWSERDGLPAAQPLAAGPLDPSGQSSAGWRTWAGARGSMR